MTACWTRVAYWKLFITLSKDVSAHKKESQKTKLWFRNNYLSSVAKYLHNLLVFLTTIMRSFISISCADGWKGDKSPRSAAE